MIFLQIQNAQSNNLAGLLIAVPETEKYNKLATDYPRFPQTQTVVNFY